MGFQGWRRKLNAVTSKQPKPELSDGASRAEEPREPLAGGSELPGATQADVWHGCLSSLEVPAIAQQLSPGHPQTHSQSATSAIPGILVTERLAFSCSLCFAEQSLFWTPRPVPGELHVSSVTTRLASVTFIFWRWSLAVPSKRGKILKALEEALALEAGSGRHIALGPHWRWVLSC